MSTQLTDRPPTTTFPVTDPAWGARPPPVGAVGTDSAEGGRPRWRRRVAAGVAALALVLSFGLAGAYATTRLDDQPTTVTTSVAAATETAPATDSLADVAAAVTPSVVAITMRAAGQDGEGSGVVLTADGAIPTNNHVVEVGTSGATITVGFSDGSTAPASVVGTDPVTDLAVIQAEGISGLRPATFGDSDALAVGDTLLAVGSPLGLEGSVTAGIVSAHHPRRGQRRRHPAPVRAPPRRPAPHPSARSGSQQRAHRPVPARPPRRPDDDQADGPMV